MQFRIHKEEGDFMSVDLGRQYRSMTMSVLPQNEKLIDTNYYVEGYAANYERYCLGEAWDGKPVYEQFTRENFEGVDRSDVIMQYDHNGDVFARCKNGSLIVRVDDKGLFIAADLGNTQRGKEVYEMISKGMIDKMSWSFIPGKSYFDSDTRTITYDSIKRLFDVSAVSIPANDTTDIHARSFIDGLIGQTMPDPQKQKRKILQIKIKSIIGGKK